MMIAEKMNQVSLITLMKEMKIR